MVNCLFPVSLSGSTEPGRERGLADVGDLWRQRRGKLVSNEGAYTRTFCKISVSLNFACTCAYVPREVRKSIDRGLRKDGRQIVYVLFYKLNITDVISLVMHSRCMHISTNINHFILRHAWYICCVCFWLIKIHPAKLWYQLGLLYWKFYNRSFQIQIFGAKIR